MLIISIAFLTTLYPPSNPFLVTKLKLSRDVWYSLYSPYFVLLTDVIFKSTPYELNCLSSLPLSRNENSVVFFIFNFLYANSNASSDGEFLYLDRI